jgi:hypothetical protein
MLFKIGVAPSRPDHGGHQRRNAALPNDVRRMHFEHLLGALLAATLIAGIYVSLFL